MSWTIKGNGTGEDLLYSQAGTPSLDLRFAATKSLNDYVSGNNLITFTRASSGTYVDSEGAIRKATTNLLLQSENFSTTWFNFNSSEAVNQAIAPDGTLTADKLIPNTGVNNGLLRQDIALAAGSNVSVSIYAKAGEFNLVNLGYFNSDGTFYGSGGFNLTTGNFITSPVNCQPEAILLSNGWYRIQLTGASSGSSGTAGSVRISSSNVGDGTSGIYLWGAQLEQSATVGEYIPTTSTINSAPRFDHNPTTGESLGLLVEEQRTNLLVRSEEFDDASWVKNATAVTANAATSPSGAATADALVEDTSTGVHNVLGAVSCTSGAVYTFSVFVKTLGALRNLRMFIPGGVFGSSGNATFNLAAGNTAGTVGPIASQFVEQLPGGWYRCGLTTSAATATSSGAFTFQLVNGAAGSYTGDGTSGIYLWGAQVEAGAFPTSYIPTTTAAVTRNADVASITGSAFSGWYRQDEGTVFYDGQLSGSESGNKNLLGLSSGSGNNVIDLFIPSGLNQRFRMVTGGVQQVLQNAIPTADVYSPAKVAYAFKLDDTNSAGNGTVQSTDTSCTIPTVDRFTFGLLTTGEAQAAARFKRLTYWPQRLANSTLQQITQ